MSKLSRTFGFVCDEVAYRLGCHDFDVSLDDIYALWSPYLTFVRRNVKKKRREGKIAKESRYGIVSTRKISIEVRTRYLISGSFCRKCYLKNWN